MKDKTTSKASREVRRELRAIYAEFNRLLEDDSALALMDRLASLRTRYAELTRLINADGGANPGNLALVSESRQLSRAAGVIEKELQSRQQFTPPHEDAIASMAALRRQMLERIKGRQAAEALKGEATPVPEPAEQPFSVAALLREQRDKDDLDG